MQCRAGQGRAGQGTAGEGNVGQGGAGQGRVVQGKVGYILKRFQSFSARPFVSFALFLGSDLGWGFFVIFLIFLIVLIFSFAWEAEVARAAKCERERQHCARMFGGTGRHKME